MPTLPDSIPGNVRHWTDANRSEYDAAAAAAWDREAISWGVFHVPEEALGSPLGDVAGLDVVELGCGTAYLSAWLARGGARPVGVDPTPAQLATARREQERAGIDFPLVEAPAEHVPLYDDSFDLAVSEYGASLWADPDRWVAEAARLLRPGGRLVFLTNSNLVMLCLPDIGMATTNLQRALFGLDHINWPGEDGIEYHRSHGRWIALLREHGFVLDRLIEIEAPDHAALRDIPNYVSVDWARRWPAEEIWVAHLASGAD